jgi:hypothetical protein
MTNRYVVALASALVFAGCSKSHDASTITAPPPGSSQTATLSISNFDTWCALSVTSPANITLPNGASGATNTVTQPVGTTITLHAEPNVGFIWPSAAAGSAGWTGGIDASSSALSKTVTVTLTANKSVGVCCPFPNGTGCT